MSSTTQGEPSPAPRDAVRPLLRARQVREFTPEPPAADQLDAILEAARWSGSSQNSQPWRFIVLRDIATIRAIATAGMSLTRSLQTATAAVAIVLPRNPERAVSLGYDEGRVAERILVAAGLVGLAAGIAWIKSDASPVVAELLGLPPDRMIRTIMAIGRPTATAQAPKTAPGTARLPRAAVVFDERWPVE